MKNGVYQNHSEKQLKRLKKQYAHHEKYGNIFALLWLFVGIVQAGTQWMFGRGILLAGLVLASFGAIAFALFDRKRMFCRYKTQSLENIEWNLSRHVQYKKICVFFGIIGLINVVIWFSIGFIMHGRYALGVMSDSPIWFLFGVILWVPWLVCRNRIQALNFIRLSHGKQDAPTREERKFIQLGIGTFGLIVLYFLGFFLSNQLATIEQQWQWVAISLILWIGIPGYALLFLIWLWAWLTAQMRSRRILLWCGRLALIGGICLCGVLHFRMMSYENSCTIAKSLVPDEAHPYVGFWKEDCRDHYGLAIAKAAGDKYFVFFCGPGGCLKPGLGPSTSLVDDPKYRILTENVIEIEEGEGFLRYYRCDSQACHSCDFRGEI